MMRVLLACNAGLSTGILQMKIQEEAASRGIELSCEAIPKSEVADHIDEFDAVLLGPQIRFALDDVKKMAGDKPVMAISAPDFGLMNAKNVLDQLLPMMR